MPPEQLQQLKDKYPLIEGEDIPSLIRRRHLAALEGWDLEFQEPVTPGFYHAHQGAHCHCMY
jgi:hypothetical protein